MDDRSIELAEQSERAIDASQEVCRQARALLDTAVAFNAASRKLILSGQRKAEPEPKRADPAW